MKAKKILKNYAIMRNGTQQGSIQAYTLKEAKAEVFAQYGKHLDVLLDEELKQSKTKYTTKLEVVRLEMIDTITSHIKKNGAIEIVETEQRHCSCCSKPFNEGYCIGGGSSYYCSERCLNKSFTKSEIEDLNIGADDSDSYWTDWQSVVDDQEIDLSDTINTFHIMEQVGEYNVLFDVLSIHYAKRTLVFNCYDRVSKEFRSFNCTYGYVSTDDLATIIDNFLN